MDPNTATEISYKNGFAAGRQNTEIATRVGVAYEQLSKCHTHLCKTVKRGENDILIYLIQDVMNALLEIEVKLGVLKHEEDM